MTCTEDQFRAILREEAADIAQSSVPPLSLPDRQVADVVRSRARTAGLRSRRWLVPLGAAAAVTAIAVAAAIIGSGDQLPQRPASGTASFHGVPPFYLVLVANGFVSEQVVVRETATGKPIATAPAPPGYGLWVAAYDARAHGFILAGADAQQRTTVFLAHFDPARERLTISRLPFPPMPLPIAVAVSPDGSRIAFALAHYGQPTSTSAEIQIYSLAGRLARTWSAPGFAGPGNGYPSLAWGPGGTLAFLYFGGPPGSGGIRLLPVSARSGDLLAASRLAVRGSQPSRYGIVSFVMTDHGATFVAELFRSYVGQLRNRSQATVDELAVFSAGTGRELRAFWQSPQFDVGPVWSNPSAGPPVVIAPPNVARSKSGAVGVLIGTRFIRIPRLAPKLAGLYYEIAF